MCYDLKMERPKKRGGYIYFLLAENIDAIKIGFTRNDIKERMRHYSCHSPYDFDLLKIIEGTMLEEAALHKRFVKYKIRSEWFVYSDEIKEFIDKL